MYFERIENLRVDKDMTQKATAELLECNQEVYRRYEKGLREIPIWALIELADFHKVSVDYILELTDVKTPYPRSKKHVSSKSK